MIYAASILYIIAFGLLNRFRGGGFIDAKFGVHRRFIVVPFVLLATELLTQFNHVFSLCVTAQYLLLVLLPWGRWYTIGHVMREISGKPNVFEKALENLTKPLGRTGSDYASFCIRNFAAMAPSIAYADYALKWNMLMLLVLFCILFVEIYRLCWLSIDEMDTPTATAEFATGLLCGCVVVAVYYLMQ